METNVVTPKHGISQANICFTCKNACGGCPWSEMDPKTGRTRFAPVPGWTARKAIIHLDKRDIETYHITACPLYESDFE